MKHKYEYKVHQNTAAAKITNIVGDGLTILELGPGPGAITRQLAKKGCIVTAIELDKAAIQLANCYCKQVIQGDLNNPNWINLLTPNSTFDAIVIGDVLEHLYNPAEVLKNLHKLLKQDGYIVVSLPNIGHNGAVSALLQGTFKYGPWGLLDRTHIRFFGVLDMQELFRDTGFSIIKYDCVKKTPEQTEFKKSWRKLSPDTKRILQNNLFGDIYQVIIQAIPFPSKGLHLVDSVRADRNNNPPHHRSIIDKIRQLVYKNK